MRKLFTYILILSTTFCQAQSLERGIIKLAEDDNVKISLSYLKKADLSKSDWLKVIFENKTNEDLLIKSASHSINKEKTNVDGKINVKRGEFGSSNKFNLLHAYYDVGHKVIHDVEVKIKSRESMEAWKYLTNYASVLVEGRKYDDEPITALFDIQLEYMTANDTIQIVGENVPFSFYWAQAEDVQNEQLVERLLELMHNPHYRWINNYATGHLMDIDTLRQAISSEDLVQGVLLREKVMTADESILFLHELKKRKKFPNEAITESFKRRLNQSASSKVHKELQYYWDDALLPYILRHELDYSMYNILEIHAPHLSIGKTKSKQVYDYLVSETKFSFPKRIHQENVKQWSIDIKTISIARYPDFEEYLIGFLDNRKELKFEDWSKYEMYGMRPRDAKPETLKLRVCDIALVALLRNMNQIHFHQEVQRVNSYANMTIEEGIVDKDTIKKFQKFRAPRGIWLQYFEKIIQLTPELRQRLDTFRKS